MRQLKITNRITTLENHSLKIYLSDISKIDLLTDDEEKKLAKKVKEGNKIALDKLVSANLRFVVSVAKQYQHNGIPLEDLINEGNLGLIKAAEKFDESRGFKFISYAVWWIRQMILYSIAENARLIKYSHNQSVLLHKIKKTSNKLEQVLNREPTDSEIAEFMDLTEDKLNEILLYSSYSFSIDSDLNTNNHSSSGDSRSYIDLIVNKDSPNPEESFMQTSMKKDFDSVLKKLTERQRNVICWYFGLSGYKTMDLEEIGKHIGLSRERVRQIKDMAIRKLRVRRNSQLLKEYC